MLPSAAVTWASRPAFHYANKIAHITGLICAHRLPRSVAERNEREVELLGARRHEHVHIKLGTPLPQPPDRIPPQHQSVRQSWDSGGVAASPASTSSTTVGVSTAPVSYGPHARRRCRPAGQSHLLAWATRRDRRIPSSARSVTRCANAASSGRGQRAASGRAAGTRTTVTQEIFAPITPNVPPGL